MRTVQMINSHCLPALPALPAAREAEQGARRLPDNERAHGTYIGELTYARAQVWERLRMEELAGSKQDSLGVKETAQAKPKLSI